MRRKVSKQNVWDWFSIYIRLKYSDEQGYAHCYTCGKKLPLKELQAGHCIAGRTNAVLFDEELVRPQCERCNVWHYGEPITFKDKLVKEYGEEWWERKVAESRKPVKYTQDDLLRLYEKYKKAVDEMICKIKNPNNLPSRWKDYYERHCKSATRCSKRG